MKDPKIVHLLPADRLATRSRRGGHRLAATAIACAAVALATPAAAAELISIDFLPAVQSITQNGRVQLVNLGHVVGSPPDPCRASIHFLDVDGQEVGPAQHVSLARGHSTSVAAPLFVKTGLPVSLRARVLVTSRSRFGPEPCTGLYAGYEVFDTATLETKFVSPGAIRGFNPQPDPPGVVGR
ncbi:MAG: hypothetical protein ABI699_05135 [Caldimonas sp.]